MNKFTKLKLILQVVMASLVATFATIGIVIAATTIGTNISTNGSLSVIGTTTLNSVAYIWPSSDGSNGQFITTNGSGTLSWSTASPSSGGGWTDGGATVYPTSMSDRFLIGTTTVAGLSQLTVEATSTAAIPLTLRGYNGQTANLLQIHNVSGAELFAIDALGNASSSALTVSGTTYLDGGLVMDTNKFTVADATGNTAIAGTLNVTGLTTLGNASTTFVSASNTGYFGGDNGLILADGSITDVSGAINFGNENLTTTGTLAAGATTINGLTTIGAYNLAVDTSTLFVNAATNAVGIGTSTPANTLEVHASTGTTTVSFISETAGVGSTLILEDIDGAGCSEITVLNGVITARTVACPAN